ncbi:MmcQ/YjbR family DNA-binding protein [Mucilaginibacter sp. AK015]|uniref:MmcQ/YjbR family DNA-binding protein n=1 Tax=Mucilaginibacter sp. AK015 TaxID=2723072 RepID=UPI00161EDA3C|nr:MmcQ/YjbR family DNA-binding protein [Mucilaginibacter sp. AK015]MBB5394957.1 putative DNA-binding protein (MmcQ/YjbR family) [Mucilaginibacter sp. AK015]
MADAGKVRQIALSLPQDTEEPHFDKTSYRVNKKIFATMVSEHSRATVKLSPADQDIFSTFDSSVIYPVPNKWGKQGWTHINLSTVKEEMLTEILKAAYCEVAPKHLAALVTFE